jgi:hypothetical protein
VQRYDIITHINRSHDVPLRPAPGPRFCICAFAFACRLYEANALWNLAVSMRSLRCMSHRHKSCARDCRHMYTSSWYRCFMGREHARVRRVQAHANHCKHLCRAQICPGTGTFPARQSYEKVCFLGGGGGDVRTPARPFSPSGRNCPTAAETCC